MPKGIDMPKTNARLTFDVNALLKDTTATERTEISEKAVLARTVLGSFGDFPAFMFISSLTEPDENLEIMVFSKNLARFHPSPEAI